jgi:hypothetical protein
MAVTPPRFFQSQVLLSSRNWTRGYEAGDVMYGLNLDATWCDAPFRLLVRRPWGERYTLARDPLNGPAINHEPGTGRERRLVTDMAPLAMTSLLTRVLSEPNSATVTATASSHVAVEATSRWM